ncbi:hypothetical protein ABL78_8501 [Leptomonas seymouri]|uniref:Uncharacterized protein n=1 Tax=Leptomonas seymouri TaxID=5684 RepID=A0A0N0P235_LEPSE|nr:hypothetical protein ABL78_8501 [Leptomonas seymouri]|eukprot:KPI82489.1 hypothetical protein ABL78_8501 [Leptomonas seymouri]
MNKLVKAETGKLAVIYAQRVANISKRLVQSSLRSITMIVNVIHQSRRHLGKTLIQLTIGHFCRVRNLALDHHPTRFRKEINGLHEVRIHMGGQGGVVFEGRSDFFWPFRNNMRPIISSVASTMGRGKGGNTLQRFPALVMLFQFRHQAVKTRYLFFKYI